MRALIRNDDIFLVLCCCFRTRSYVESINVLDIQNRIISSLFTRFPLIQVENVWEAINNPSQIMKMMKYSMSKLMIMKMKTNMYCILFFKSRAK